MSIKASSTAWLIVRLGELKTNLDNFRKGVKFKAWSKGYSDKENRMLHRIREIEQEIALRGSPTRTGGD